MLYEKDHNMIETRRLKNVVIFIQTILSFVLSRKIIKTCYILHRLNISFLAVKETMKTIDNFKNK